MMIRVNRENDYRSCWCRLPEAGNYLSEATFWPEFNEQRGSPFEQGTQLSRLVFKHSDCQPLLTSFQIFDLLDKHCLLKTSRAHLFSPMLRTVLSLKIKIRVGASN